MNAHCLFRNSQPWARWMMVGCLLWTAGCGVGTRSPADTRTFLLQIDPAGEGRAAPLNLPLRIRPCRVAAPFVGRSLAYRLTAVQYQYDLYNTFLVPLSDQLDDALYRWLEGGAGSPSDRAAYTLDPYLETLTADFADPNRPLAVARMRIVVTHSDPNGGPTSVAYRKTLTARIELQTKPSAEQVVAAFSTCMRHILGQLRSDLAALATEEGKKDRSAKVSLAE
jgi:hypothetical protein